MTDPLNEAEVERVRRLITARLDDPSGHIHVETAARLLATLDAARESRLPSVAVERLMDAEHRWCVEVDGDFALRHELEAHRKQAEFVADRLASDPAPAAEPDLRAECDWGDCDERAIGLRLDAEGHGWLPVCQRHWDAAKIGRDLAPFDQAITTAPKGDAR